MGVIGLIMLFVRISPEDTVGVIGLIMLFVPENTVGVIGLKEHMSGITIKHT